MRVYVEPPVDGRSVAIDMEVPGLCFFAQREDVRDAGLAQALATEQADRNLGLVEPAFMFGVLCTVNRFHNQPPSFSPKCFTSASRRCVLSPRFDNAART